MNTAIATHSFKYVITNYINNFLFIKLEKPVSCLFAEFSVSIQFYLVLCAFQDCHVFVYSMYSEFFIFSDLRPPGGGVHNSFQYTL